MAENTAERKTIFHLDGNVFRQEKVIAGILHRKYNLYGNFEPYTLEELTNRILLLEARIDELEKK